jgi:hypothetical protein
MSTNVTPALRRVLGELQTVRARIDRQIAAIQSLIRLSAKQRTVKTHREDRSPSGVGGLCPRPPSAAEEEACAEVAVGHA